MIKVAVLVGIALLAAACGQAPSQTLDPEPESLRVQVYELTAEHLRTFPVWQFALDEEGVPGQDEATVRPLPNQRFAHNADVARATFVAADGTQYVGYVTPDPSRDPGYLQPTIVTERGQVGFWLGWQPDPPTIDTIAPSYELLGSTPDDLFPLAYSLDVPWSNAGRISTFDGSITGFGWLADLEGDSREIN